MFTIRATDGFHGKLPKRVIVSEAIWIFDGGRAIFCEVSASLGCSFGVWFPMCLFEVGS